jgi:hypothetical protein
MATATIRVAGKITVQDGKTVCLNVSEVAVAAEISGQQGFAANGGQYYEVSCSDVASVRDGDVVGIVSGDSPTLAAAYARDGHSENGVRGAKYFRISGRGKQFGGKIRLYGTPVSLAF